MAKKPEKAVRCCQHCFKSLAETFLDKLGDDLIQYLFQLLDFHEFYQLSLVNKYFHKCSKNPLFKAMSEFVNFHLCFPGLPTSPLNWQYSHNNKYTFATRLQLSHLASFYYPARIPIRLIMKWYDRRDMPTKREHKLKKKKEFIQGACFSSQKGKIFWVNCTILEILLSTRKEGGLCGG